MSAQVDDLGGAGFSFEEAANDLRRDIEATKAQEAFKRADAWAHSVPGTPYGVTTPVLAAPRSGKAPDPLDQRVMARLHGEGKR